jgi:hypothetical protein
MIQRKTKKTVQHTQTPECQEDKAEGKGRARL